MGGQVRSPITFGRKIGDLMNGVILYEGLSKLDAQPLVVIATGLVNPSQNGKTGEMIQVWILRSDMHPMEAIVSGHDYSICGDCIHRKHSNPNKKRTCYVRADGFNAVFRAYLRGNYPTYSPSKHLRYFKEQEIRWGAYGDPALIPYVIVEQLSAICPGWTGYTHLWKREGMEIYQDYFQASCDNLEDYFLAEKNGWATFHVLRDNETHIKGKQVVCQGGVKTTCKKCLLCNGKDKKHIVEKIKGGAKKNY